MLHHVAIEIRPDEIETEGEFWVAVGFERVEVPEALGRGFAWYEREGTQVHLMETSDPARPPASGHIAVVAAGMDSVLARLEAAGCALTESRRLWGARRVKTSSPSGYVIELMEYPPESLVRAAAFRE